MAPTTSDTGTVTPRDDASHVPSPARSRRPLYFIACGLMVLVIVGLLIAIWMPALYTGWSRAR